MRPAFDALASPVPLLGITGWSGAGKTTLIEALLPLLDVQELQVAVLKHAHHGFTVDQPGKDSDRFRQAGAVPVIVASARRFAVMMETPQQAAADEPDLPLLLDYARLARPDLILIEGFKNWPLPRLQVCRPGSSHPGRLPVDGWTLGIASPEPLPVADGLLWLPLDQPAVIAGWIMGWQARWPGSF